MTKLFLCSQTQLTEKEMVRLEIQALLDQFYVKQSENGKTNRLSLFLHYTRSLLKMSPKKLMMLFCFLSDELNEAIKQSMRKELQEERAEKVGNCLSVFHFAEPSNSHLFLSSYSQSKTEQKLADTLKK